MFGFLTLFFLWSFYRAWFCQGGNCNTTVICADNVLLIIVLSPLMQHGWNTFLAGNNKIKLGYEALL